MNEEIIIETTTTIKYEGKILFKYNAEDSTLAINSTADFELDIGSIPVDLCFPIPGQVDKHYCFKKVSRVVKLEQNHGLIHRFSKFIKRG